jgi:mRNA-degrading endonuclease toxin of MazEF toxin-antitoxin module
MSVDPSQIVNGGIYRIRDSHVRFPESLWRRPHRFRTVMVVSSDYVCQSADCGVVSVAPMSTDLRLQHPTDLIIRRNSSNGLNQDGRLILGHIQPVPKTSFERQFGQVDDNDWHDIITKIIDNLDR